jgi:XTP/dITP diphosphohydrolase
MKIIFATNNQNKVSEIRAAVPQNLEIVSLKEAGIDIDIPEPHNTLQANAQEKAVTIFNLTGNACFSEDTGLEVHALNGAPGVHSARYAGEDKAFASNIQKLLTNLEGQADRSAQFRTVICLKTADGTEHYFEGICKGTIIAEQKGNEGFGYDPVFIPDGAAQTFAEMSLAQKNGYSHRRKAVDGLVAFLNGLQPLIK